MHRIALLPALAAGLLLGAAARAQTPDKPPPWWGVQDENTVSLYWNFDTPFPAGTFPAPTATVVPSWYQPAVTLGVPTPNLVWIPSLAGNIGVLGMVGSGSSQSAALDLTVDNEPHQDWIKIFWFQFDVFEGTSGSVIAELEKNLAYDRAGIFEKHDVSPLGNGWERVTVAAQLIPQPDDEGIDWSFFEGAFGTVAIDNLYVNSKCVKPGADEVGNALGDVNTPPIDLTQLTGGAECRGVAATQGPAPAFARRYWISTRAASVGTPHSLLRIDGGAVSGTTAFPDTISTTPNGLGDLTVETVVDTTGAVTNQLVYVIADQRPSSGQVFLRRVDQGGTLIGSVVLNGFPSTAAVTAAQTLGLAFDPSGDLGAGTFWVSYTDQLGNGFAREYSRSGTPRGDVAIPSGCSGLGYDDILGNFYGWSRTPTATPTTPIQANGFEWSGYDFQPTGVRFCGDLTRPNGLGPRGGVALGFDVYRRRGVARAALQMVCLVDTPNAGTPTGRQWLYEIAGPFRFGFSVLGRCRMENGPPFVGSTNFQVGLSSRPRTLFAMLILGFSNTTSALGPLPLPLGLVTGWDESILSISPDVTSALLAPTTPGEFSLPIPIPAGASLAYTPIHFQWLALDTGIAGGFALTQGGKTVIYP